MAVRVTVEAAARRFGGSSTTVRRRLTRGRLQAVRVETPQGHQWPVHLDGAGGRAEQAGAAAAREQTLPPPIEQVSATDALTRELARLEQDTGPVAPATGSTSVLQGGWLRRALAAAVLAKPVGPRRLREAVRAA